MNEKDLESTVVFYFILFLYSLMFGLDNSIPGSASSDWNFFLFLIFYFFPLYLFILSNSQDYGSWLGHAVKITYKHNCCVWNSVWTHKWKQKAQQLQSKFLLFKND